MTKTAKDCMDVTDHTDQGAKNNFAHPFSLSVASVTSVQSVAVFTANQRGSMQS